MREQKGPRMFDNNSYVHSISMVLASGQIRDVFVISTLSLYDRSVACRVALSIRFSRVCMTYGLGKWKMHP